MLTMVNLDLALWIEEWENGQVKITYENYSLFRRPSEIALYSSHLSQDSLDEMRESMLAYEKEARGE